MAQQGMFGNYQQQIADETALRRQSAQTGGLTGWAAITNAMSGIGSEIGYQGGQAMGGMTPVQAEQARFQSVMDSFDFDPTNPDSMMEGSAALNAAGFYDKGLEMFNLSNKVRSDNLSYDVLKMQADKLENPDDEMIQENGIWYYSTGDKKGDRVLTADIPIDMLGYDAKDLATRTFVQSDEYLTGLKTLADFEAEWKAIGGKDSTAKAEAFKIFKESDGFKDGTVSIQDFEREWVNLGDNLAVGTPKQTEFAKFLLSTEYTTGLKTIFDFEAEWKARTAVPNLKNTRYEAIPPNEATAIGKLVDVIYDTSWETLGGIDTDVPRNDIIRGVYMIARNENMLPSEVLKKKVIGEDGNERIISPTDIVKYYTPNGLGDRTGVVNTNGNGGGGNGDTKLRLNTLNENT
mgnify:FL=1